METFVESTCVTCIPDHGSRLVMPGAEAYSFARLFVVVVMSGSTQVAQQTSRREDPPRRRESGGPRTSGHHVQGLPEDNLSIVATHDFITLLTVPPWRKTSCTSPYQHASAAK